MLPGHLIKTPTPPLHLVPMGSPRASLGDPYGVLSPCHWGVPGTQLWAGHQQAGIFLIGYVLQAVYKVHQEKDSDDSSAGRQG